MHYNRVYLESIGYELPPVVVSTTELEARLNEFLQSWPTLKRLANKTWKRIASPWLAKSTN